MNIDIKIKAVLNIENESERQLKIQECKDKLFSAFIFNIDSRYLPNAKYLMDTDFIRSLCKHFDLEIY